ncbi:MAG: RDD family protein [Cellvibrionaceae bacterium]
MSLWLELGVEPNANLREIKRAYAKQLKVTRPEVDPVGFQKLHSLYLQAMEICRHRAADDTLHCEEWRCGDIDTERPDLEPDYTEWLDPYQLEKSQLEKNQLEKNQFGKSQLELEQEQPEENRSEGELPETEAASANQKKEEIVVSAEATASPVMAEDLFDLESLLLFDEQGRSGERLIRLKRESDFIHGDQGESLLVHDPLSASSDDEKKAELKRLLTRLDQLLNNNRLLTRSGSWTFLQQCPYLLDAEFNVLLGDGVFSRILAHNAKASAGGDKRLWKRVLPVCQKTLTDCDQLFGWSFDRSRLDRENPGLDTSLVFEALSDVSSCASQKLMSPRLVRGGARLVLDRGEALELYRDCEGSAYELVGIFRRILAASMDILLLSVLCLLVVELLDLSGYSVSDGSKVLLHLAFALVGYCLIVTMFECSSWQASPGKRIMGYKVTTHNLERITFLRGFWRLLCLSLTLPLLQFTLFINIVFLGKYLIHDRLSRTYVVMVKP